MTRSKEARSIRFQKDFHAERLVELLKPPRGTDADVARPIDTIIAAREAQLRGDFREASRMAKMFRTDDALFTAWQVRLSPEASIAIEVRAVDSVRGAAIGREAEAMFGANGIGLRPETRQDILDELVNHGVAIAYCHYTPRDDGSRVDLEVRHWPLEHVRWNRTIRSLVTRVDPSCATNELQITHGDGRWIVFAKSRSQPWVKHACLLPAALVWMRHAFANRDWMSASFSHGNSKVTGELPPEYSFFDQHGELTSQAAGFLGIIRAIAGAEACAGIIPPGAKISMMSNLSTAHQIWSEIVNSTERAAHRIYCGTDASLGSPGGAPGVDIESLFGVSNTLSEGDLRAIERGIQEGAVDPWTAINFGDSSLAPRFHYLIPDHDEQAERIEYSKRMEAFAMAVKMLKENEFLLDNDYIKQMAHRYDVDAPVFPKSEDKQKTISLELAPTDVGQIVLVDEARNSQGLGPIGDERGSMTIGELALASKTIPQDEQAKEEQAKPT